MPKAERRVQAAGRQQHSRSATDLRQRHRLALRQLQLQLHAALAAAQRGQLGDGRLVQAAARQRQHARRGQAAGVVERAGAAALLRSGSGAWGVG
jgi:hypothetical protein